MIRIVVAVAIALVAVFLLGDAAGVAPISEFILAGLVLLGGVMAAVIAAAQTKSVWAWVIAAALGVCTVGCGAVVLVELSGLE